MITRRRFTAAAAASTLVASPALVRADAPVPLRFTLDWKLQGLHAPFLLALAKGYDKAEGIALTIDQGEGSAATITRVMSGAYDAGFGDINALIQNAATRPADTPVMVYMLYSSAPFALVMKASSPIRTVADLAGRKLGSPAGGAALKLLPALGAKNGLDPAKVEIVNMAPNLQEQLLVQGQVDVSAVFNVTSYATLIAMKLDPDKDFRWITYSQAGLDLYSNGLVVSRKLLREKPEAVRGLVRAINRATLEVAADPAAGVAAVAATEPLLNKTIERARLDFALRTVIATPEAARIGVGDVDDARLAANIATIAAAYDLPKRPEPAAVFDRSFLPSRADRMLTGSPAR